MTETLAQLVKKTAKQVKLDDFDLNEYIELAGVNGKRLLNDIECLVQGDNKSPIKPEQDLTEKTAVKAVEMGESFLRAYDGNALVPVGHVADFLKYIPASARNSYLGTLRVLADQEYGGANKDHVIPKLVDMMSIRFVAEYRKNVEDHSDRKKYGQAIEKLQQDVDKFLAYAKGAVAKNINYQLNHETLRSEDCFKAAGKKEGINYALLSEDALYEAANGPVDAFIRIWGTPSGIANRGIRDGTDVTLKMFFGDNGEHQVAVTYPSGLPSKHLDFFKGMATIIDPIDALKTGTRKCGDFLRTL